MLSSKAQRKLRNSITSVSMSSSMGMVDSSMNWDEFQITMHLGGEQESSSSGSNNNTGSRGRRISNMNFPTSNNRRSLLAKQASVRSISTHSGGGRLDGGGSNHSSFSSFSSSSLPKPRRRNTNKKISKGESGLGMRDFLYQQRSSSKVYGNNGQCAIPTMARIDKDGKFIPSSLI